MTYVENHPMTRHGRHAGPATQDRDAVPAPSYAERVRTLLHLNAVGTLSTHSARCPGFPFGSVMPFALDDAGRPTFLISAMAMHTHNLAGDRRASLLVADGRDGGGALGAGRVTLLGEAQRLRGDDVAAVRAAYLERHADARHWVDYDDFTFWQLSVVEVYYVGGFGVMGWVEADDYTVAVPDPLAEAAPGIVAHMNEDHVDAMVLMAKTYADLPVDDATMTGVDRLGFHLRVTAAGRTQGIRLAFPEPVESAGAVRAAMVDMVKAARGTSPATE